MKNCIRLLIFSVIAIALVSCFPKKKMTGSESYVTALSDTTRPGEGSVVYALPRTVFTFQVEMEREVEIPGPYAKYAGDLLGLKDVILAADEHWKIKSIVVHSHEEADPSEFYIIQATTLFRTNVLALKKEGLILDLNPEVNNRGKSIVSDSEVNINQFRASDLGSDEYFSTQTDTAYKRISMDSTFIRIPYVVEKKKKLTQEQLADRAARTLMELREGKILILTGEANVYPQNEAAINEINRIENEYTELFTGRKFRETRVFTYQVIPEKENGKRVVSLFSFSGSSGPVNAGNTEVIPVKIEFAPEQKTKDLTIITRQQADPASKTIDKLYYRVPDVVNVKILMGNEVLYNSRKLIYQFGQVVQLPANYIIGK